MPCPSRPQREHACLLEVFGDEFGASTARQGKVITDLFGHGPRRGFTNLYRACVEYRRCIRPGSLTDARLLPPRRVDPVLIRKCIPDDVDDQRPRQRRCGPHPGPRAGRPAGPCPDPLYQAGKAEQPALAASRSTGTAVGGGRPHPQCRPLGRRPHGRRPRCRPAGRPLNHDDEVEAWWRPVSHGSGITGRGGRRGQ
jgi:hypothetical protein